ncbi:hypothetical protein ACPC54_23970 [Kitasatospora sp. NPDC094028]
MSTQAVDVSVLGWMPTDRPADVAAMHAELAVLAARVPDAGVSEVSVSLDGTRVELAVRSVTDLSAWYDALRCGSASVASRGERRVDGQLYGLGGLHWQVLLPALVELPGVQVALTAESGEFEELPDTRLVRHLCPAEARLRAIRMREAANARRMGWVA